VFGTPDQDDDRKHDDHAARIAATLENSDDDLPELQPASDSDLESESDFDEEFVPPPKSTVPVSDAVGGVTTSVGSARIDLLHRRLGHLSESGVHLLRRRGLAPGVKASEKLSFCESCARVNRASFPTPRFDIPTSPLGVLDEVHADLTGPITPSGLGGVRELSLTIEKSSRRLDSFQAKDEAFDAFQVYRARSEKQIGRPIKTFWTDQGGEYVDHRIAELTASSGMIHQFSVPYEYEQNGLVERPMRTVMTVARALLHIASMPRHFLA
jgi:transposase InsO family protein